MPRSLRAILTAGVLVLALAVPMTASAHTATTPRAAAWQVKDLATKNWKFAQIDVQLHSVTCQSRGREMFICKGRFTLMGEPGTILWSKVTTSGGYLRIGKGVFL